MELKEIIKSDINTCIALLNNKDYKGSKNFIEKYVMKYNEVIENPYKGLNYYGIGASDDRNDVFADISNIKEKLEITATKTFTPIEKTNNIVINNKNNNSLSSNIEINLSFNDIRRDIEEMSALNIEQIDKIIEKVNEIEEVSKMDCSSNKKWGKLKDTLNWLSTTGVDVATKVIPLILKTIDTPSN